MTNGQIAQLQELGRCWCLPPGDKRWIEWELMYADLPMTKIGKTWLRSLTHQYRHQIAAMRKNRA